MSEVPPTHQLGRISAGVGGALALEFTNTAGAHLAAVPSERLTCWRDFVRWAAEQDLLEVQRVASLASRSEPLEPILSLREALFRAGIAASRAEVPSRSDLTAAVAAASVPLPPVIWRKGRLRWRVSDAAASSQLLGLIARDGIELLAGGRVERLRVCEGVGCGWLFLDDSRGRPRRWCSMDECGNRAKARSAYARAKARRRDGA